MKKPDRALVLKISKGHADASCARCSWSGYYVQEENAVKGFDRHLCGDYRRGSD